MKRLFERLFHEGKAYKVRPRSCPIPNPSAINAHFHIVGMLWNWKACWVGFHYSSHNKRLCVNIIPCLTLWWVQPGGMLP